MIQAPSEEPNSVGGAWRPTGSESPVRLQVAAAGRVFTLAACAP
jgi:hypothetical protein